VFMQICWQPPFRVKHSSVSGEHVKDIYSSAMSAEVQNPTPTQQLYNHENRTEENSGIVKYETDLNSPPVKNSKPCYSSIKSNDSYTQL